MSFVEVRIQRIAIALCFALTIVSTSVFAQEADTEDFATLQQQWTELEKKLVDAEANLNSGEGELSAKQDAFRDMVSEANTLIKKLKTAAMTALEAKPNDPAALQTVLGIMLEEANSGDDGGVLIAGDKLIAQGINPEYFKIAAKTERLSTPARELFDELVLRHEEALANDLPRVKFETSKGDIVIELFENEAPNTVGNFVSLVENDFYSDLIFHRVIEGFMAQGGGFKMVDGKEVGGEGPGYEIKCECEVVDRRPHFSGSLSMAHRGKDTGGSQFFITFERTSFLDGRHTCFGRVVEGHDVLEAMSRTHISIEKSGTGREEPIPGVLKDRIVKAEVVRKRNHEYKPDKTAAASNEEAETEGKAPELSAPENSSDENKEDK